MHFESLLCVKGGRNPDRLAGGMFPDQDFRERGAGEAVVGDQDALPGAGGEIQHDLLGRDKTAVIHSPD